jgi:hypothetical protein
MGQGLGEQQEMGQETEPDSVNVRLLQQTGSTQQIQNCVHQITDCLFTPRKEINKNYEP